jgi:hypothetical protein
LQSIVEGKARGRAAAFIAVMGVLLVWLYFQDRSPRVRTDHASATVIEVKTAGWQVKLGTGETLWLFAHPGVTVKQGDVV